MLITFPAVMCYRSVCLFTTRCIVICNVIQDMRCDWTLLILYQDLLLVTGVGSKQMPKMLRFAIKGMYHSSLGSILKMPVSYKHGSLSLFFSVQFQQQLDIGMKAIWWRLQITSPKDHWSVGSLVWHLRLLQRSSEHYHMIDINGDSVRQSQHVLTLILTLTLTLNLNPNPVTLWTCDPSDQWPFGLVNCPLGGSQGFLDPYQDPYPGFLGPDSGFLGLNPRTLDLDTDSSQPSTILY